MSSLRSPSESRPNPDHQALVQRRRKQLESDRSAIQVEFAIYPEWVVELGCGHGHFLTSYADSFPSSACVGIDICADRIRRARRKQARLALANLRFVQAEALEFLRMLSGHIRISRIFVLFPDPWPKRRHRKNRVVSPEFLDTAAAVCRPGAEFFFRSDAADYVQDVRTQIAGHPAWRIVSPERWPHEHPSVFQAKAPEFESLVAINSG